MAYNKTNVAANPILAQRDQANRAQADLASRALANQGRAVQQGPANYAGRARAGYVRPAVQQGQPADRAFARGASPAQAPPPPRAMGGQGNTGTVQAPGPGQTNTFSHGPGHVAGRGGNIAAPYSGMMRGNTRNLTLAGALGRGDMEAPRNAHTRAGGMDLGASANTIGPTAQAVTGQNGGYNASVLGSTPANMAVGGAGTAQGSVQGRTIFDDGADYVRRGGQEVTNVLEGRGIGDNGGDSEPDMGSLDAEVTSGWYDPIMVAANPFIAAAGGGGGNNASTPFGKILQDIIGVAGNDLSGATDKMNTNDMAQIDEHFGESAGAYRDIINMAKNASSPEEMARVEAAARGDLYSGINNQRDAAQRQLLASSGRGGYQSSGAQTGIYNAAMQAAQAGERGLTQDAFGRRQAATQLGMTGLGAGASALENLKQSGFTSNKELMALLLGAGKHAKDNLNPFSFTNL